MKMVRLVLIIILCFLPFFGYAVSDHVAIRLESVRINPNDHASVLRGAKFFAQNCMVCHTMKYLKYNKLAEKAGVTLDKMPLKEQEWWLGIVPPDLTLIARQRSGAWLYTYLHAFYKDPSRPTGYNNLLAKDINMTNVLAPYQGEQVLTEKGKELMAGAHPGFAKPHYYTLLELVKSGSMTPEEYDRTMRDLVNFLVYASDPAKTHHEYVGVWVIAFLLILAIMAFFLKKMYWKDVE